MRIKDEKKYMAIVEASMKLFMQDGFSNASISKIAKEAGVSPATIYIHFENKEDLILKLYLKLRKEMSECIVANVDLEGCIESEYKKLWKNYYNYCIEHKASFNYIMQFTNSPYMDKYKEYGMCYFKSIYQMFERGKERGLIKQISDEILFAFTFSTAAQLAKRHDCCGDKLCDQGVENASEVAWDAVRESGSHIGCRRYRLNLIDRLVEKFRDGETHEEMIGVEFEHFLVDKESLRSYHYDEPGGQHDIVKAMVKKGWEVDYEEDGNILSIIKSGNMISFEPGGQFEISVKASESLEDIEKDYLVIRSEIETFLNEDQALVSLGYHPQSKIDDLPLLPKARYDLMYDYLHKHGFMARNMMKGTASTQVVIDYKNEADFIKKYRVANFLSPFIAKIFDASPVFEGKIYSENNLRIKIWENTDITRSKYPDGVLNQTFDYKKYAEYIAGIKPVFLPCGGDVVETHEKSMEDLYQEKTLSNKSLIHGLSMVFPDVRLKNYIEIRMPDALPYPYSMAVPALIKGIFYNGSLLDYYYKLSLDYNDHDLVRMEDHIKRDEVFKCGLLSSDDFIKELIEKAGDSLRPSERKYLDQFVEIYKAGSISDQLKALYGKAEFGKFLRGEFHV
ncbi:TetR family transcriptional regulator [Acidaminobacter sp. JC074]|uniref:glutamate-cysteine ligase family protein n=1 Tax=Acidaminobacter sp. JC074 TaxID=2530199 RepID=UPI001F10DD47|nr:glutamate-cysteine ligase family protein [Acidaminobacter sp. JC074]MCH4888168.1 TetR family transcriptional regulator [Acidaminobacter sp. JC074]